MDISPVSTKSPSELRPYIGSRRSRNYINNNLKTSSLLNDYFPSTTSSSESTILIESEQKNDLSNAKIADVFEEQEEEEQLPLKYFSARISQDAQQPYWQADQKAKGFLPSSSSSSHFFSPTTPKIMPLSVCDHSSSPFDAEQQYFHSPSRQYEQHLYWQPLNTEKENNQLTVLEKSEQPAEEQRKQKHSSANSISLSNQNLDLTDIPEENSVLSSGYSFADTIIDNNYNDNQSYLFTSTPVVPPLISQSATSSNKIFPGLLSDKNNTCQLQPLQLDCTDDQSSTIITDSLITDLHCAADTCQLNNMSSLRHSSNLGSGATVSHQFDQRITDQGSKYIIQLRTDEFQENEFTIKPRYSFNQLIIDARHREEDSLGGYIHRELHKVFTIPKHIDLNQYTYSYNKQTQELTIEMLYLPTLAENSENRNNSSFISPFNSETESLSHSYGNSHKNGDETMLSTNPTHSNHYTNSNNIFGIGTTANDTKFNSNLNISIPPIVESSIGTGKPFDFDLFHRSAFRPQIVRATSDNNTNDKKLIMSLDLSDYQPEDIKVSVKDRELIVKAERKIETGTRKSRTSFFQSTTLPPQTDIDHLQSNYTDGKLVIESPFLDKNNTERKIISTSNNNTNEGHNWPTVADLQQQNTYNNPFEQRTETITEFVRRHRQ